MKYVFLISFVLGPVMILNGQPGDIPEWFLADLEAHIGVWTTDNSQYRSDAEPIDAFGMEWKMAIGGTSMTGRLYGLKDNIEVGTFWEFREFWDPIQQKVVVQQFGQGGMFGKGILINKGDGHFESIQTFATANGKTWKVKHVNIMKDGIMDSKSFNQDEEGKWIPDRSYIWIKQLNN